MHFKRNPSSCQCSLHLCNNNRATLINKASSLSTSKIIVIGHCNRSNNGATLRQGESLPSLSIEPNLGMQICSMSSFQWMAE